MSTVAKLQRVYFSNVDPKTKKQVALTPRVLEILQTVKTQVVPDVQLDLAPVGDIDLPPNATVLAFGPYRARGGERVVSGPSGAQIVTSPSIITRLTNMFELLCEPPELPPFRYMVMEDAEGVLELLASIQNTPVVVDIETSGDVSVDMPDTNRIISISITSGGMNLVIPEELWHNAAVRLAFDEFLASNGNLIITVNGKFDLSYFPNADVPVGMHFDVQLAHYALYPAAGEHGLKPVTKKYFGFEDWDEPGKVHTKTGTVKEAWKDEETGAWADARKYSAGSGYERIPRAMLYKYNGFDTYATWHWYLRAKAELEADPDAMRVFKHLMKLSKLFMGVERRGITLDIDYLEKLSAELHIEKAEAEKRLEEIAGQPINPRSPKQVKEWFAANGVKLKGTAEQILVDFIEENEVEVVEEAPKKKYELEPAKPYDMAQPEKEEFWDKSMSTPDNAVEFAKQILVCRGYAKTLGTYVDGYKDKAFGNKVYPGYRLIASVTGRLGGQGASMLTIPRDKRLKRMVTASAPGRVVVQADMSQAELRVMAIESMDQWLIDAFQPGAIDFFDNMLGQFAPNVDWVALHARVEAHEATEAEADYYNKMRAKTKGTAYGKSFNRGERAIAKALKISVKEAYKLSDAFIRPGSAFAQWRDDIEEKALNGSDLISVYGRHLQSELVTKQNRQQVINSAMAFTSQSTANDICLTAALMLEPQLAQYDAWLMGTIHDNIVSDVPEEHADAVGALTAECLRSAGEQIYGTLVPFAAEYSYAKTLAG